jgi:hypothetical protein
MRIADDEPHTIDVLTSKGSMRAAATPGDIKTAKKTLIRCMKVRRHVYKFQQCGEASSMPPGFVPDWGDDVSSEPRARRPTATSMRRG